MCSPSLVLYGKRTLREWPVSDGFGFSQEAQNVGNVARAFAIAAAISTLAEGTLITGERSSALAADKGAAKRTPRTATTAIGTTLLRHLERAEVIVTYPPHEPGVGRGH